MSRLPAGIILIILLTLGIWAVLVLRDPKSQSQTNLNTSLNANQSISLPNANTTITPTEPYPVSIEAMRQKTYDGRDLRPGRVLANDDAYIRHYVTYRSGDLTISGVLNIPKGDGPFPVLILAHGYIDPAVYTNGRGLRREQDYLAKQGFAVLHPDYRGHANSTDTDEDRLKQRLGYVKDVINAIKAVQSSGDTRLDGSRVGLLGHSMGGGVGIFLSVIQPELVDAIVLYAPVHADMRESYKRWIENRPEDAKEITENYGSIESNPEFWDGISARLHFDAIKSPMKVFHGTSDADVPYDWSAQLEREVRLAGKDIELVTFMGEGHEFGPKWTMFMQQSTEFFRQHLK